jgi:hypothetical protein
MGFLADVYNWSCLGAIFIMKLVNKESRISLEYNLHYDLNHGLQKFIVHFYTTLTSVSNSVCKHLAHPLVIILYSLIGLDESK